MKNSARWQKKLWKQEKKLWKMQEMRKWDWWQFFFTENVKIVKNGTGGKKSYGKCENWQKQDGGKKITENVKIAKKGTGGNFYRKF